MNDILEQALKYQAMGLSIIPVGKDKKPLIAWADYQERCATTEEITAWWTTWPNANIALITGGISKIVALDLDAKHGRSSKEFKIPPTACAKSGSGGEHFFCKHPGYEIKNGTAIDGEGVDFRGDGGYILLAPSINENGAYEWIVPLEDGLADMPGWLIEMVTPKNSEKKWETIKDGSAEGSRNNDATIMAGKILYDTKPELQESLGWPLLQTWNQKNTPPLPESELRATWESIKKREDEKKENKDDSKTTKAKMIVELIGSNENITLFHNEASEPFIRMLINGHYEIWRCKSKQFRRWLAMTFYTKFNEVLKADALSAAMNIIEAIACFDGEEHKLNNRIAWVENAIWYDLSDKNWQAVKITEAGWSIEKEPPILFSRFGHQKAQATPVLGGNIDKFLDYLNLSNSNLRILAKVYLVSCFIPDFPHPIIVFYGEQGAAKTTACSLFKLAVDPSQMPTSAFPKNKEELTQMLSHHWAVYFDNVSYLSESTSDALCRAVTGAGFSKRELYSDDEDIIYSFKRCLGVNGINLVANRSDLLQRSILMELKKIPETTKREEAELILNFEKDLPGILGAIFDTVVSAIKFKKNLGKLASYQRMADFTAWGCAIAQALGYSKEDFLNAYADNIGKQNKEAIENDTLALLIKQLMTNQTEWEGTATDLLIAFSVAVKDLGVESRAVPKSASTLSHWLNKITPNLEYSGYSIYRENNGEERKIIIKKNSEKDKPSNSATDKNKYVSNLDAFVEDLKAPEIDKSSSINNPDVPTTENPYSKDAEDLAHYNESLDMQQRDEDGIDDPSSSLPF